MPDRQARVFSLRDFGIEQVKPADGLLVCAKAIVLPSGERRTVHIPSTLTTQKSLLPGRQIHIGQAHEF